MGTRIEKLNDKFFAAFVNVGNMPKIKADEYCKEIMQRMKEQMTQDERVVVIPFRPDEYPSPIIQYTEKAVTTFSGQFEFILAVGLILVFLSILFH